MRQMHEAKPLRNAKSNRNKSKSKYRLGKEEPSTSDFSQIVQTKALQLNVNSHVRYLLL
jgi:hypothetical protein